MRNQRMIGLSLIMATFLVGCATTLKGPGGIAQLSARSGSNASGIVSVSDVPGGVKVQAKVSGLTPGQHGFHIHEVGDCSAPDATSAKGHFNPAAKEHGLYSGTEHHGGDMPNLIANSQGDATYSFELMGVALTGPSGVIGRSVVIHADPDDYKSQPAGNSGKRIACGVIASQ